MLARPCTSSPASPVAQQQPAASSVPSKNGHQWISNSYGTSSNLLSPLNPQRHLQLFGSDGSNHEAQQQQQQQLYLKDSSSGSDTTDPNAARTENDRIQNSQTCHFIPPQAAHPITAPSTNRTHYPKYKTLDPARFRKHLATKVFLKNGITSMQQLRERAKEDHLVSTPLGGSCVSHDEDVDDQYEDEEERRYQYRYEDRSRTKTTAATKTPGPRRSRSSSPESETTTTARSMPPSDPPKPRLAEQNAPMSITMQGLVRTASRDTVVPASPYFAHPARRTLPVVRRVLGHPGSTPSMHQQPPSPPTPTSPQQQQQQSEPQHPPIQHHLVSPQQDSPTSMETPLSQRQPQSQAVLDQQHQSPNKDTSAASEQQRQDLAVEMARLAIRAG